MIGSDSSTPAHAVSGLIFPDHSSSSPTIASGVPPPSALQVPGATDVCVEVNTLSKTYSMAGFRVGFALGNERLISALGRVKSYLDYGAYTPVQVAAAAALNGPQECVDEIRGRFQNLDRSRLDKILF